MDGSVIAATTPIMPRVINTSARVKPFLQISSMAALNGSLPASIPRLVLKLLCPPPENHCYHCIFHNSFSFLVVSVLSSFLSEYKAFWGHASALLSLSPQKVLVYLKGTHALSYQYIFSQTRFLSVHSIVSKRYTDTGNDIQFYSLFLL